MRVHVNRKNFFWICISIGKTTFFILNLKNEIWFACCFLRQNYKYSNTPLSPDSSWPSWNKVNAYTVIITKFMSLNVYKISWILIRTSQQSAGRVGVVLHSCPFFVFLINFQYESHFIIEIKLVSCIPRCDLFPQSFISYLVPSCRTNWSVFSAATKSFYILLYLPPQMSLFLILCLSLTFPSNLFSHPSVTQSLKYQKPFLVSFSNCLWFVPIQKDLSRLQINHCWYEKFFLFLVALSARFVLLSLCRFFHYLSHYFSNN